MQRTVLAASVLLAIAAPASAAPPMPTYQTDAEKCRWEWQTVPALGGTLGAWTEDCAMNGQYKVVPDPDLPGFVLTVDGEPVANVVQVFAKPADAGVDAILPALRAGGYIPDDDDCVMKLATDATLQTIGPRPRTQAFFEVMPTGARLAAFEATPEDEVPEPPCPDYGWSTHGTRYFLHDLSRADRMIYIDVGQDGTMFDPRTLTWE